MTRGHLSSVLAIGAAVAILCSSSPAVAQRLPPRDLRMEREMRHYFAGEKAEGWVFAGAGALSIGAGALGAFAASDEVYRGAGWPMLVFGSIQLAAGAVLLVRTDRQVRERSDRLLGPLPGPSSFYAEEIPRMARVRENFRWLEVTELVLAAAGIGLATYGGLADDRSTFGVGAGIAIESALMLVFDQLAAERAARYDAALHTYGR